MGAGACCGSRRDRGGGVAATLPDNIVADHRRRRPDDLGASSAPIRSLRVGSASGRNGARAQASALYLFFYYVGSSLAGSAAARLRAVGLARRRRAARGAAGAALLVALRLSRVPPPRHLAGLETERRDGMARRGHRHRRSAAWRELVDAGGDDARAWPPSRPGARRALAALRGGAATRQHARPRLARAPRRASRRLRGGAAGAAGRSLPASAPALARRSAISARCCACCPSATRTRRLYDALSADRRPSRRCPRRAGADRALRGADAGGMRLRARSLECAATGAREDLIYVSPKSGRAVSAAAGAPGRDRLLPLPAFLRGTRADARAGRGRRRVPPHRLLPDARSLRPARPADAGFAARVPGGGGQGGGGGIEDEESERRRNALRRESRRRRFVDRRANAVGGGD